MDRRKILAAFEKVGYQIKILPTAQVDEVVSEICALFLSDSLDSAFASKYRNRFQPGWGSKYPEGKSVILLAVPAPMLLLRFTYRETRREIILPPGYHYSELDSEASALAKNIMNEAGFTCEPLQGVPLKLLAVRSGLCIYGKNNIAYCEKLGSLNRLYGFVSNLEAGEFEPLRPVAHMQECENCGICAKVCPTSCIEPGRNIIHADRCLPFYNENEGVFPEWMSQSSHNAIVGCMACQRYCPKNRGLIKTCVMENAFDEKEIDAILAGGEFDRLPVKTQTTLKALNLDDIWHGGILSRNLKALLTKNEPSAMLN